VTSSVRKWGGKRPFSFLQRPFSFLFRLFSLVSFLLENKNKCFFYYEAKTSYMSVGVMRD
jgi:hypothetical protein